MKKEPYSAYCKLMEKTRLYNTLDEIATAIAEREIYTNPDLLRHTRNGKIFSRNYIITINRLVKEKGGKTDWHY